MAERIETYQWKMGGGGGSKYPWDEWADGTIWRLTKEEDFPYANAKSLRVRLYKVANERGMKVRSAIEDGGALVFQFYYADKS